MERWIQMHYQIKKREQALELAQQRELFYWLGSFYITTIIGSISVYRRMKNSMVFLPLLPLTFVMGYSADLAYGNKIQRIKGKSCKNSFKKMLATFKLTSSIIDSVNRIGRYWFFLLAIKIYIYFLQN